MEFFPPRKVKVILEDFFKSIKVSAKIYYSSADTDETLGLGLKVSVSGPIPGLGLGLGLDLGHF